MADVHIADANLQKDGTPTTLSQYYGIVDGTEIRADLSKQALVKGRKMKIWIITIQRVRAATYKRTHLQLSNFVKT
jgi:hypothetical protein